MQSVFDVRPGDNICTRSARYLDEVRTTIVQKSVRIQTISSDNLTRLRQCDELWSEDRRVRARCSNRITLVVSIRGGVTVLTLDQSFIWTLGERSVLELEGPVEVHAFG